MSAVPLLADINRAPAFLAGWRRWWIVRWSRAKIVEPSLLILRRGAEPKQLAFSAAMGFTTGVFPLCGLTAALCACVALVLRSACHPPTMMLANFLATPVELSLIVPFMRFGEKLLGAPAMSLAPDALLKALTGKASHRLLLGLGHALLGWIITAPFLLWFLYRLLLPVTTRLSKKLAMGSPIGQSSAPTTQVRAFKLAPT
eukprot:jgi/Mesen1/9110/ME000058S08605